MEQNKKTGFIKGAAILAATSIVCKVLGVLFRVFAIRILGEQGMYFYEKVYPTYSWLLIISSSGIPIAISRMVAARIARGALGEVDARSQRCGRFHPSREDRRTDLSGPPDDPFSAKRLQPSFRSKAIHHAQETNLLPIQQSSCSFLRLPIIYHHSRRLTTLRRKKQTSCKIIYCRTLSESRLGG